MKKINNKLYIGGQIYNVSGIPCYGVAEWDGNNWHGIDFPNLQWFVSINAIAEFNGEMYVAGSFCYDLNDTINNILRWDGISWHSVNGGLPGISTYIQSMVVYNSELYIGGYFFIAEGNKGNFIQKWNGTSWSKVGNGGPDGQIYQLIVHKGLMLAMGVSEKIFVWDKINWTIIENTFGSVINSAAIYNDTLHVGGSFITIDGDSVNHIVKWTGGNYTDTEFINTSNYNNSYILLLPNPFSFTTTIKLSTPLQNASLIIYDILGRKIRHFHNLEGKEVVINREGMQDGIYYYSIFDVEGLIGTGKMILE
jgi:hypothetical protein